MRHGGPPETTPPSMVSTPKATDRTYEKRTGSKPLPFPANGLFRRTWGQDKEIPTKRTVLRPKRRSGPPPAGRGRPEPGAFAVMCDRRGGKPTQGHRSYPGGFRVRCLMSSSELPRPDERGLPAQAPLWDIGAPRGTGPRWRLFETGQNREPQRPPRREGPVRRGPVPPLERTDEGGRRARIRLHSNPSPWESTGFLLGPWDSSGFSLGPRESTGFSWGSPLPRSH